MQVVGTKSFPASPSRPATAVQTGWEAASRDPVTRGEAVRSQTFVVQTQRGWKAGTCRLERCFISENE